MYKIKVYTLSLLIPFVLTACNTSITSNDNANANNSLSCEVDSELKQQMLTLVNNARTQDRSCNGQLFNATTAVTWNDKLAVAAKVHSDDMATNNFFAHQGSNSLEVGGRVQIAGYTFITVGENLYAGAANSAEAIEGLLNSTTGHCENIMDPNFKEMGVACTRVADTEFGTYYTQVLGAQ